MTSLLRSITILLLAFGLSVALVAGSPSFNGPSPDEYGILQVGALRNNTHNLVVGWRQYGDRLIYKELVKRNFKFMQVVTAELKYPAWGYRPQIISHVMVIDLTYNGYGGYANITSGGVGFRNIAISFKSQRGRGLKFMVKIFGN